MNETESDLVNRAREALSRCHWEIGECASLWTQRYSRGRTDADFGALIGLSGDQVFQRRRVWERFADLAGRFASLKWSHYYAALNWNDAEECLAWAEENRATIAQMKAWRRALRGEDLSTVGDEEPPFDAEGHFLSFETGFVQDPSEFVTTSDRRGPRPADSRDEDYSAMAFAARQSEEADAQPPYAPFGKGARGNARSAAVAEDPQVKTLSDWKRVVSSLERCNAALTPGLLELYHELPLSLRERLANAVESISNKLAGIE